MLKNVIAASTTDVATSSDKMLKQFIFIIIMIIMNIIIIIIIVVIVVINIISSSSSSPPPPPSTSSPSSSLQPSIIIVLVYDNSPYIVIIAPLARFHPYRAAVNSLNHHSFHVHRPAVKCVLFVSVFTRGFSWMSFMPCWKDLFWSYASASDMCCKYGYCCCWHGFKRLLCLLWKKTPLS